MPAKGGHLSEEQKQKISAGLKGKPKPPRSEVHCKHLSESKMGADNPNFGKHWTDERKQKMLKNRKWYHHSDETKQNISNGRKGKCVGPLNHQFGKPIPDWQKEILRQRKLGLYDGPKHPQWKGGISKEPYPFDFNDLCKEQARQLFNYQCALCGLLTTENGRSLDTHHIDYNKRNLDITNLIPLCRSCHLKTNHNREYWKMTLKEKMITQLNDSGGSNPIPSSCSSVESI
jgi:hypothetical protein